MHFDSSKGLWNNNIGLGAEAVLTSGHLLMAGSFINSNRQRSHYAGYPWRPLHWQLAGLNVGAGIAVSAFDGYPNYRNRGWFIAPLPMLSVEGKTFGANISLIPTVANRFDRGDHDSDQDAGLVIPVLQRAADASRLFRIAGDRRLPACYFAVLAR